MGSDMIFSDDTVRAVGCAIAEVSEVATSLGLEVSAPSLAEVREAGLSEKTRITLWGKGGDASVMVNIGKGRVRLSVTCTRVPRGIIAVRDLGIVMKEEDRIDKEKCNESREACACGREARPVVQEDCQQDR